MIMKMTLLEVWNLFLEERSISVCPTTLATDYSQTSKWIARCPIQDIDEGRQILIWVLKQEPIKSSRKICMFIRSMYRWASSEDVNLIFKNPVLNFKMPKTPQNNHEIVVIPRDEIPIILNKLKEKGHHRAIDWSLYAEFMLQTGMRTGEVRALKWSDIENDHILVHSNYTLTHGYKNSTKTNKQRKVPINSRLQEIINIIPRTSEYLFPWNRYSFQSFFRDKMDELYDSGIVKYKYRPYDLRHVAISRWLEAGIPVTQAASWAGNTSEIIWKHYAATTTKYEMPVL